MPAARDRIDVPYQKGYWLKYRRQLSLNTETLPGNDGKDRDENSTRQHLQQQEFLCSIQSRERHGIYCSGGALWEISYKSWTKYEEPQNRRGNNYLMILKRSNAKVGHAPRFQHNSMTSINKNKRKNTIRNQSKYTSDWDTFEN